MYLLWHEDKTRQISYTISTTICTKASLKKLQENICVNIYQYQTYKILFSFNENFVAHFGSI